MMVIFSVEQTGMEVHARMNSRGLEEVADEIGSESTDTRCVPLGLEDTVRPAAQIDDDKGQTFVHRYVAVGCAHNARAFTQTLTDGLSQADTHILHRVVLIDVQVTPGLECEVEETMMGEEYQHMVEKADAGIDIRLSRAIEFEREADIGLICGAVDCNAHGIHWGLGGGC